jgi:CheY-like chemotaxis protein
VGAEAAAAAAAEANAGTAQAPAHLNLPTGRERIVLVEDQQAVRAFVRDLLESLGYKVHAYADGGTAEAAAESLGQPPDLLVADVVLPGPSGPEVADALRRRWPSLKVLFVSGFADDGVKRRESLPGVHFLAKPFRAQALAERVREILDVN